MLAIDSKKMETTFKLHQEDRDKINLISQMIDRPQKEQKILQKDLEELKNKNIINEIEEIRYFEEKYFKTLSDDHQIASSQLLKVAIILLKLSNDQNKKQEKEIFLKWIERHRIIFNSNFHSDVHLWSILIHNLIELKSASFEILFRCVYDYITHGYLPFEYFCQRVKFIESSSKPNVSNGDKLERIFRMKCVRDVLKSINPISYDVFAYVTRIEELELKVNE